MSKLSNKQYALLLLVCCLVIGVITFTVTYIVRNNQMDKEIQAAIEKAKEVEQELQVVNITNIQYNDKSYEDLESLEKDVYIGDTLTVDVKYENGETKNKKCYVVKATNDEIQEITYQESGDIGVIVMPYDTKAKVRKKKEVKLNDSKSDKTSK